jgi:hypothetical protein
MTQVKVYKVDCYVDDKVQRTKVTAFFTEECHSSDYITLTGDQMTLLFP